jgi:hypothetical protein
MVQDGPRIGSLRSSRAVAASGLRVAQVMDALVPWEISSPSNPVGGPWKHWLLGWLEVGNTQLQLEVPKQNELWLGTCLRSQFPRESS